MNGRFRSWRRKGGAQSGSCTEPSGPARVEDEAVPDLAWLLTRIDAGSATRHEIMGAVDDLIARAAPVPLPIEKRSLEIHISENPGRIDLKKRLVQVHHLLEQPVPADLQDDVNRAYFEEERNVDHATQLADFAKEAAVGDMEAEFFAAFEAVRPYTMTTVERCYALWKAIRYLIERGLEGDLVETGVWRGGSMMLTARELVRAGILDRTLWLYDTFAGLPRPDAERDIDLLGNRAIDRWEPRRTGDDSGSWAHAPLEEVRDNMRSTGYAAERCRYVVGKVEDTIPEAAPEAIALLRIDTDWYASYAHVLNHLYDRVVQGGILILDDYGHFRGARQAVDEFLEARGLAVPMVRIDYSARLIVKL